MKIIIVSDSHGSTKNISRAISENPDAEMIFHAGDGALDMNDILPKGMTLYRVRGNCDGDIPLEDEEIIEIGKIKVLLTHGHKYRVSYFREPILQRAKELDCAVVVYGHTHKAVVENTENILFVNPGTCNKSRSRNGLVSYGVMLIEDDEVMLAKIINL